VLPRNCRPTVRLGSQRQLRDKHHTKLMFLPVSLCLRFADERVRKGVGHSETAQQCSALSRAHTHLVRGDRCFADHAWCSRTAKEKNAGCFCSWRSFLAVKRLCRPFIFRALDVRSRSRRSWHPFSAFRPANWACGHGRSRSRHDCRGWHISLPKPNLCPCRGLWNRPAHSC